jgi:hypothetical protein
LSFLGIATMLDNHWGYLITSRNLATHYFFTSSLTFINISSIVLHSFYLTRLQPSIRGNICATILVSKPSISAYDKAKTSAYFIKQHPNHFSYQW